MKIWKTKFFQSWQKKLNVPDEVLSVAVHEMQQGLIDADLGGGLVKKRVSRPGAGKRSGYRTLLATNKKERWFFMYGFAKKDKDNISGKELLELKELADYLLSLSHSDINDAIKKRVIKEVQDHE
jgi:hypothetical protein